MKLIILLMICFHAPVFALTLEEAQKLAIKNGASLLVLQSEIGEAKARRDSADFLDRPKLGIAAGGEFEANVEENTHIPLAYGYFTFTLYDGYQARIQQTTAQKELEKIQLRRPFLEFESRMAVEDIFLEVSYREEKIKTLRKELELFDGLKVKAANRRRAGIIGDADIYEFELRKTVLTADLEVLQSERENFLQRLYLLTGVASKGIKGYAIPEVKETASVDKSELKSSLESQLIAKEQELLILGQAVNQAKWGPQVEFEARAGRLPSEGELEKHKPRVNALLLAKWDLFNYGQKNAASQEIMERQKTLQAKAHEEQIKTENLVLTAKQNLEYLRIKASLHKRKTSPTKRYFKAMLDEYERGVKNSPDVAHAAELLFELEYQDLEIRRDWAKQKLELEKTSYQAF